MGEFLQVMKNAKEEEEQQEKKTTTKQGHDEETEATPTMFHVLTWDEEEEVDEDQLPY